MKKSLFAVLIIACLLVIAGCVTPEPKPAQVTAPVAAPVTIQPPPATLGDIILTGAKNHMAVRGDMLSLIAAREYGQENMYYFPLISLANPDITDPDVLAVEKNVIVPDLQANLNNPGARASIKAEILSTAEYYERKDKPRAAEELRNFAAKL